MKRILRLVLGIALVALAIGACTSQPVAPSVSAEQSAPALEEAPPSGYTTQTDSTGTGRGNGGTIGGN